MLSILKMFTRSWRVSAFAFVVLAVLLVTLAALRPKKYEAHMSFLVRNERTDLLISTDAHQTAVQHGDVTEEDVNSEVELLGSAELLRSVAKHTGLDREFLQKGFAPDVALEKATLKLSEALVITPVRKSALITVDYVSADRDGSVRVLKELADEALEEHSTLDRAGSAAQFFRDKSRLLANQLHQAQEQRATVLDQNGFTLLPQQTQLSLQAMVDDRKARADVDVSLADTFSRLQRVHAEQKANMPRMLTQQKVSDNQYSIERLNTLLAELQNRRTEFATKYKAGDRLLDQVDREIADTRIALTNAERLRSEDNTTDVNPVRQTLDQEALRLSENEAGLRSRRANLDEQIEDQKNRLGMMERAGIQIGELDRNIEELTNSLKLYREKAIAAGVSEDLDEAKISNVVVASQPIVPALPKPSPFNVLTALALAVLLSLCAGVVSSTASGKVYGAEDVEAQTGIAVLVSLDRERQTV